jgi:hypothetical protein
MENEIKRYRRPNLTQTDKQSIREYLATEEPVLITNFRYRLPYWSQVAMEAGMYPFLFGGVGRNILTPRVKAYLTWVSRETIRDAPSRDN